jgi:hypothetical protein
VQSQVLYLRLIFLVLLFFPSLPALSLPNTCLPATTSLKEIIKNPKKYKGQKVFLEGEFYSFTNLSLDYSKAFKDSKDYIGIILSRPDYPQIPLVELKLAVPLEEFKDEKKSIIEHGDKVIIEGVIYAIALGEPWIEVKSINKVAEK